MLIVVHRWPSPVSLFSLPSIVGHVMNNTMESYTSDDNNDDDDDVVSDDDDEDEDDDDDDNGGI